MADADDAIRNRSESEISDATLLSHLAKPVELEQSNAFLVYSDIQDYLSDTHCIHSDVQHSEVSSEYYP